jgi:hypothetical protein
MVSDPFQFPAPPFVEGWPRSPEAVSDTMGEVDLEVLEAVERRPV